MSHYLNLPKTSDGLTAIQSNSLAITLDDASASTSRKVARINAGSDSATASRSRLLGNSSVPVAGRPTVIQLVGDYRSAPPASDKELKLLHRCIRMILTRDPVSNEAIPATYEGIYNACRSVVTVQNRGQELYDIVKMELDRSIMMVSRTLPNSKEDDITWISSFNSSFNWLEGQINILRSLLTYLDQVFVVKEKGLLSVRDIAYQQVNEWVFGNAQLVERLRSGTKEWLNWERYNGQNHQHQDYIHALVQHLIRHHQYSYFEDFYVSVTRTFYLDESNEQAEKLKDSPKAFFENARSRIDQEVIRSKTVLPVPSWSLVRKVTEEALWTRRMDWLANSTLASYMESKDFTSLGAMYTLFSRVDGVKELCDAFRKHIHSTVSGIVKDVEHDDDMVQKLLDFKELADATIASSFFCEKVDVVPVKSGKKTPTPVVAASASQLPAKQPDQQFLYALTDAFNMGFKSRRSKPAEMIAKYVDKAMRKGQGKSSDAEFRSTLDKVLVLYRFTDDKDVFRTFYHRSLAKRLLLERSASDDFEKAMLKKLKEDYDPEFGMGEDMFKDLSLSRESMREYHSKLPPDSPGHKLNAMVLQRSAWPFTAHKHAVDLPPAMQEELTRYSDYYKSKHSGHVLDWDHSIGTVTMKAKFSPGVKELSVSLYQGIVLLLFSETTEIPYVDIRLQTGMRDEDLKRTLQSLACGKKKVLKKVPPGKDVDDTDVFKYNPDFDDPRAKVHINSIQAKVSPEESKRTNASIEDDRKHYLDAAIVRIMKARKEMTYEQLKAATIEAVKGHFVPQIETIKKRIDSLVETDYLERSKEDKTKFLYVA